LISRETLELIAKLRKGVAWAAQFGSAEDLRIAVRNLDLILRNKRWHSDQFVLHKTKSQAYWS